MSREMGILDHIEELRKRVIRIFLIVGIVTIFCLAFGFKTFTLNGVTLAYPYPAYPVTDTVSISVHLFNKLVSDLVPENVSTIVTTPVDAFFVQLKIAIFLGIAIGMPGIVYHIGKFIAPGLYPHERKIILRIMGPATFLFIVGCIFSYVLIIPFTFRFLYGYAFYMVDLPFLNINDFISFILLMMVAFGLVFELPVIMVGLTSLGVTSAEFWKRNWRYAIAAIFIFAAIITPDGTGVTQTLVAGPMLFLYFAGYLMCNKIYKERSRKV
jgi:sec-independent protein translocase protein TatC